VDGGKPLVYIPTMGSAHPGMQRRGGAVCKKFNNYKEGRASPVLGKELFRSKGFGRGGFSRVETRG